MSITPSPFPDWMRATVILDPLNIWGYIQGIGLGEVIACLSPGKRFDNRGQIFFLDSFEEGLSKGWSVAGATNGAVELSTTSCKHGGYGLKLTTGSGENEYSEYGYPLLYPIFGRVGVEVSFTVENDTEYIIIEMSLYDGSTQYIWGVRYDEDNNKIQYKPSVGDWTDLITGVALYEYPQGYHTIKMVVDLGTKKYLRVLVDGWSWTTGDLDIYTHDSDTSKRYIGRILHYGASGKNAVSYIDNVIFTQNEPT